MIRRHNPAFYACLGAAFLLLPDSCAATSPGGEWFNPARLNNFAILAVFLLVFGCSLLLARRSRPRVRRLPGMEAMEKAVRSCGASGRPVLYVTGVGTASSMPTIASLSILGEISAQCAACGARLIVPHYDPVVMGICREVVRKGYERAGRASDYSDGINFFVSQDQFSFVAAVDGLISREKPGACFYMGQFMAESLLLTEVGAASGAVQVAGTDAESQLSFFHASCDHTLVGEEFYAAGACFSEEPLLLGSLRAQDLIKALAVALAVCAIAAAAAAELFGFTGPLAALRGALRIF